MELQNSWWAADLLHNYTIAYVTLTNRDKFGKFATIWHICLSA